jgi:phosphoribosylaminoimidazolecarboxamide formyltransferase / IMP cyclohydrolase
MMNDKLKVERALLSVTDKTGIEEVARALIKYGVEIISSGGTQKYLEGFDIPVTPIEEVTGNPESFSGRMKTISFQIGSALLYRRGDEFDEEDAEKLGIKGIDLVVCNLYQFDKATQEGVSDMQLIEYVDIGGPTMIRAAAKNHDGVCVLTHPDQYQNFIEHYESNEGHTLFEERQKWGAEAFKLTALYDLSIAREMGFCFHDSQKLRYGENPHQKAIRWFKRTGLGQSKILQGKPMSYNNFLDTEAAWKACSEVHSLEKAASNHTVVVVKHLTPCGIGMAPTSKRALELAWEGDPVSAFGGIIAFSTEVKEETATWLSKKFIEIIVAPSYSPIALEILGKKANLRLVECPLWDKKSEWIFRSQGGVDLIQEEDTQLTENFELKTLAVFPDEKIELARFGEVCAKYLKSNAISIVTERETGTWQLIGAGMGQPNRLDSIKLLAVPRALEKVADLEEVVMVSDAFFPFSDGVELANKFGIRYIVQPGGSIRDQEVIDRCDENGQAMVFTGLRHFRH